MTGIIKEERIGNQRLILGDCLEVMPGLAAQDAVIGDPPYEVHMHAAKLGVKTRRIRTDGHANPPPLNFADIGAMRRPAARQMVRLSLGWVLVFCTPEGVAPWRDALEGAGARYKRACVWVKPDSAPQFNGQGPAMGAEMFCAAWAGRGHSRWNGGGRRGVFTHPCQPPSRSGLHPTEKPLSLMGELIGLFTDPGATVLDPFMGAGSTLVSCQRLGRAGTGIEIDPDYFEAACRRVDEATRQPDMFVGAPAAKPDQMGMLKGGEET
ncbi:MAG: DNA methyltransferase [Paracoccaceae bacterium]|nr:DNA methyltransferase [Paracoccaceae bacterium]